ncbi:hypothetical protein AVEN_141822-1 [Araneus ventricosus]|uniref:Uncharacterized protein n=1 Tax=Araneus ventricosus TaxID=182803 RepID=A0A4Y2EA83_ARAVE|nr:hypothetical protein AVEN_141822-1 [Araneus ventricosus]
MSWYKLYVCDNDLGVKLNGYDNDLGEKWYGYDNDLGVKWYGYDNDLGVKWYGYDNGLGRAINLSPDKLGAPMLTLGSANVTFVFRNLKLSDVITLHCPLNYDN